MSGMTEHLHIEEPAFAPLEPINVKRESDAVRETYKNFVLNRVNDHCIRVAVMHGEYPWHHHPRSDETFLVVEGVFEIDLEGGRTVTLRLASCSRSPLGFGIGLGRRSVPSICVLRTSGLIPTSYSPEPPVRSRHRPSSLLIHRRARRLDRPGIRAMSETACTVGRSRH